jgi:hypothetical protein
MLLIRHRVNTVQELKGVPVHLGVEIDLRAEGESVILQHEPFQPGELFEDFLKSFSHAFLILNVKTDGLDQAVLKLVRAYGIRSYFFLDLTLPAMVRLVRKGERGMAVRFSEVEPVESCLAFKGKADWVWADCFQDLALDQKSYAALKPHFKICLVSPELEGHPKEKIADFKARTARFELDAVCTKHPELWGQP